MHFWVKSVPKLTTVGAADFRLRWLLKIQIRS